MICRYRKDPSYSKLMVLLLLLTGLGPMAQLKGNPWKNIIENKHVYNMPFKQGPDFFNNGDNVKY